MRNIFNNAAARLGATASNNGAFRLGRLRVTPGFLLIIAAACIFEPEPLLPFFLAAALLHELGHLAALRWVGGRAASLTLSASGAVLDCDMAQLSYPQELTVYASGVAVNLVVAMGSAFTAGLEIVISHNNIVEILYIFTGANVALAAFNLLPARALDGGRAIKTLCMWIFGRETVLPRLLHLATLAALIALCVWTVLSGGFNVALLWMALWLLLG